MKFAVPGAVSAAAGAVVGVVAVWLITMGAAQDSRPDIGHGDASSSLLNNVEYGSR
jgi:hypothetical protein